MIYDVLKKLGLAFGTEDKKVTPFKSKEDGAPYEVWSVETGSDQYVLKKAKAYELEVYRTFFAEPTAGAPTFLGAVSHEGVDYFLMSYADGEDLCRCTRPALINALDALIALQNKYWNDQGLISRAYTFEVSLERRVKRGQYLGDALLEAAYERFLDTYQRVPRTLCHDDLLPFNVLAGENSATLIDWEYGGILPYLSSLARFIAHGEEDEEALFYMTDEDKQFAVDYYYEGLVKQQGISYETYRRDLDDFLLYEYCEWIMLGNRYGDTGSERFRVYLKKALAHIGKGQP